MTAADTFQIAWDDLLNNYWDGDVATGHIVPQTDAPSKGMWPPAQFSNLIYWNWKNSGDPALSQMIQSNFNYLVDNIGLGPMTDANNRDLVGSSDDAAWNTQMFFQVYDACGDQRALDAAKNLIVSTRSVYAGPENNAHGLYYNLPNLDSNHRSSLYEVGIGLCAFYIWSASAQTDQPWFDTAVNTYAWLKRDLTMPSGIHFCEFSFNDGPGYKKPVGYDHPNNTNVMYLGGTLGMATLASLLFAATSDDQYRMDAVAAVDGILSMLLVNDTKKKRRILNNNRDAWTEGFYLGAFVQNVLPLDGVNPLMSKIICNTGAAVFNNCRTPDGHYSADWAGGSGWTKQGETAQQIMTSSNSVMPILARSIILP